MRGVVLLGIKRIIGMGRTMGMGIHLYGLCISVLLFPTLQGRTINRMEMRIKHKLCWLMVTTVSKMKMKSNHFYDIVTLTTNKCDYSYLRLFPSQLVWPHHGWWAG